MIIMIKQKMKKIKIINFSIKFLFVTPYVFLNNFTKEKLKNSYIISRNELPRDIIIIDNIKYIILFIK